MSELLVSSDGGAVWNSIDTVYDGGCVFVHPESTNLLVTGGNVAVSPSPALVSVSRDTGRTWTRHVLSSERGMVLTAVLDPHGRRRVYLGGFAGSSGAVFLSDDFGASWKRTAASPPSTVWSLAVHPADSNLVYVATSSGLSRTTDGGESWAGICTIPGMKAVKFFPGYPDTILAAGRQGAYLSPDAGQTWTDLSAGLPARDLSAMEFSGTDSVHLLVGTRSEACFALDLPVGVAGAEPNREHQVRITVAPNPVTSGSARVRWAGTATPSPSAETRGCAGPMAIRLFDASGRLVLRASLPGLGHGPNCPSAIRSCPASVVLDLRSMSAGVYVLRLTTCVGTGYTRIVLAH